MRHQTRTVMREIQDQLDNEHGAALAIVIMLLLGLAAMGASTVMISSTDYVVAGNDRARQAALDVAEAGISEAVLRLGLRPGTMVNVGGGAFDASIQDPSDPPDPNWSTRIYLTDPGAVPPSAGSNFSTASVQGAAADLQYSHASDPNQALIIQHKLRDFDGDGTDEVVLYDASRIPPENPFTGDPVERVIVGGVSGSARRQVLVDAIRFPISPNATAALACDAEVDLRGNVTVCGRNHRVDTPPGTSLPSCSPNWDEADGHLPAVMTTGDPVGTRGSTDLLGNPVPIDDDANNTFLSLAEALGVSQSDVDDILANADYFSEAGTWPREGITYINGDARITGGGSVGEGLMYVTGDLDIAGGFTWRGLVYVEGDLKCTGNGWILGGVIVRGDSPIGVDFGAGSPAILYSYDMIQQALSSSMRYIVLNWKEL